MENPVGSWYATKPAVLAGRVAGAVEADGDAVGGDAVDGGVVLAAGGEVRDGVRAADLWRPAAGWPALELPDDE